MARAGYKSWSSKLTISEASKSDKQQDGAGRREHHRTTSPDLFPEAIHRRPGSLTTTPAMRPDSEEEWVLGASSH